MVTIRAIKKAHGLTFCVILLFLCPAIHAQEDSLELYQKIKKIAEKNKLTALIYGAIFIEPKPIEYPTQPTSHQGKVINPYLKYKNKIIRNIYISVFDPFGCSVNDTICKPLKYFERFGNRAHFTTKKWVVNNKLLFKKNDKVNPLYISESERLLRQSTFANDARIYITRVKRTDSVDVHVTVLDKWSITVPAEASDLGANIRFDDQNLFGLGQQLDQYARFSKPDILYFSGFYNVSNIDNTYISSRLSYQADKTGTSEALSFDRPFYSPLAKWAGGLYLSHTQHFYPFKDSLSGSQKNLNVTGVGCDVWAGKTLKILKDGPFFSQSNNLIIAGRYFTNTFLKRPSEAVGLLRSNNNSSGILGNIGYAIQQYYKDKYIYRFGANEDVPEGLILQFTYGGQKKEFAQIRYYTGFEIARAKHYDIGYLSSSFSYGMYFDKYYPNDITINYKMYYFSDLFKKDGWYFRQFINYSILHGQHKFYNERITLTSSDLYGFNSATLSGNTKMVMNLETVAYAPYNIIGFRLAPVLAIGYGMLGDPQHHILKSNIYQAYSLGIMFRNENLLVSTFQFSFGLYPYLPDGSSYAYKLNPVTSFTIRVRAFSIGRPDFITYY